MAIILLLMLSGIISGMTLGKYPLVLKINERLLHLSIYVLLFLLGITVGANEKIVSNFYLIGVHAVIITAGAIAGSVAMCLLIYKTFFHVK